MNAALILRLLHEHRATVHAVGGNLRLRAPAPLPEDVLNAVRTRKAELLALLTLPSGLTADTADDDWNERAAICEHDAGLSRREAEAVADACHPAPLPAEPADWKAWFDDEVTARIPAMGRTDAERRVWGIAIDLWHRQHGERPDPHRCAGCGRRLDGARVFGLPDGAPVHDGVCNDNFDVRQASITVACRSGVGHS